MRCPFCQAADSRVVDSRDGGEGVRRRRVCSACGLRFTTYERPLGVTLMVIKKDGRREEFQREKILSGIRKACAKRPVSSEAMAGMVDDIEAEVRGLGRPEVPTSLIGEMVMARLRKLDHIAYIRFASVYREFADLGSLKREVDTLMARSGDGQLPLLPRDELPGVAVALAKRVRRRV